METIKANSLMLNDWVKIKEPNKYAGAIGTIQTFSSLEGAYLAIYINDTNFGTFVTEVFCEDIEPIPLTAENLMRNGFIKGIFGTYRLPNTTLAVDIDAYGLMFLRFQNCQICEIKSVSHLQHLIRDLGITKEIVL